MKKIDLITMGVDRVSGAPIVFLKVENTNLAVPIVIGACEASILAMAIQKEKFERPLSYDLIDVIIKQFKAQINEVVIDDFKNNVYFSKIILKDSIGETIYIDSRPSDALIISVKNKIPVFIKEEIAIENSIEASFLKTKNESKNKNFLDDFNIDDLKKKFNKNNDVDDNDEDKKHN